MTNISGFKWPGEATAGISLTYDDSLSSQLDNAVPQLAVRGLQATFFVNPGASGFRRRNEEWIKLLCDGHELGNHTFRHPCSTRSPWVKKGMGLEDKTESEMENEIVHGFEELLRLGAPRVPSFAYPCGQKFFGTDRRSFVPMVARHHLFGRGVWGKVANPNSVDLLDIPSVSGAIGLDEILSAIRVSLESHSWLVLHFHGIGGDHLRISEADHIKILDQLCGLNERLFVRPLAEIGELIRQGRNERVTI